MAHPPRLTRAEQQLTAAEQLRLMGPRPRPAAGATPVPRRSVEGGGESQSFTLAQVEEMRAEWQRAARALAAAAPLPTAAEYAAAVVAEMALLPARGAAARAPRAGGPPRRAAEVSELKESSAPSG